MSSSQTKSLSFFQKFEKDENWQVKTKAINRYCENPRLDWEYRIITEKFLGFIIKKKRKNESDLDNFILRGP